MPSLGQCQALGPCQASGPRPRHAAPVLGRRRSNQADDDDGPEQTGFRRLSACSLQPASPSPSPSFVHTLLRVPARASSGLFTFHVKNSRGDKYTFTLPLSTTALDLKTKLAAPEYANLPVSSQRLIYSGKVLKDGDTLAQHNVKEGNSMHLVKSAASNQRQNPATQSSSTASGSATGTPSSNPSAAGVPQNLASGTGNDPLAGLTGARYAGFTQLPSADLFQNPPTQEDVIRQLQDPNFAQMMREAMNNPSFIDMMINTHPHLRDMGPQARQILQSEQFRRMMTNPDSIRQMMQMQQMFGGGGLGGLGAIQQANPFAALFNPALLGGPQQQNNVATTPTPADGGNSAANAAQQQNPFAANPLLANSPFLQNPQQLQQMLQNLGLGDNTAGNVNGAPPNWMDLFGPGLAAAPDNRPPEERYATQLRQLNEMGFHDFDRNIQALSRSGGDVNGALEWLFTSPLQSCSGKKNVLLSTETHADASNETHADASNEPHADASTEPHADASTEPHADASTEAQAKSENTGPSTGPSTAAIASNVSSTQTVLQATSAAKTEMADAQSESEPALSHAAPASPSTPQQTGNKLPRPKYKDEKMLQSYIAKAHALVREGTAVALCVDEQEKAVNKYAEMVSQMTHLLATLGLGRNTTVRALAYLSGSDPPDVKTALRQAKQDRREQNTKKRQASEASTASHKIETKNSDNTINKPPSASTSSNDSTDGFVSLTNAMPVVSGQTSLTDISVLGPVKSESQSLDAAKTKAAADATDRSRGAGMQKKRFTRKWWSKTPRRNRESSDEANKKTQATGTAPKLDTDSTGAVAQAALIAAASSTA
ncbi:hypothetical protein DV737_g3530, partial [Chaetothyriales sp. CBS 132003]